MLQQRVLSQEWVSGMTDLLDYGVRRDEAKANFEVMFERHTIKSRIEEWRAVFAG